MNQSRHCDFTRNGNGTNGHDADCNDEFSRYSCRIRNASGVTADLLLASELELCSISFPDLRNPADQLAADLRKANRSYRQALRTWQGKRLSTESLSVESQLHEGRESYRTARAALSEWRRACTASRIADVPDPPTKYGVFVAPDARGKGFRSITEPQTFRSLSEAYSAAREQETYSAMRYEVRAL